MPTVAEIHAAIQSIAPDNLAEPWDNVGLLAGSQSQQVNRILVALDPCMAVCHEAQELGCDLIITHHPAIFKALKSVVSDAPAGAFLAAILRAGISLIACHTSFDSARDGVSHALALGLGLEQISPLEPAPQNPNCGLGALGRYPQALSAEEFTARLRAFCTPSWILAAGPRPKALATVAVCGGSGSSLAETALMRGAEVYVTAELKHNVARWAEEAGLWILDAGHFATENQAMSDFAQSLAGLFASRGWQIPINLASQSSPLNLLWPAP